MSVAAALGFAHLEQMSDHRGLFEHAEFDEPRVEHGYCTDDNARLLAVTSCEPDEGVARRLGRSALGFVIDAQDRDGRIRNRMDPRGHWTDRAGTDDCWGRAVGALGQVVAGHAHLSARRLAADAFDRAVIHRSPWRRSMAFAAIGAAEVLAVVPDHAEARALLSDSLDGFESPPVGQWPWPEARLTYANATLAEAVIAAGAALGRDDDLARGLAMLTWLLEHDTRDGHLSVTGVGGSGPADGGPQFDQQPIEVAAMAEACWRAHALTGDRAFARGVAAAAGWFAGENDAGLVMYDERTGGGYDGLGPDSVNLNQGAESTLALVATMQRAWSFVLTP